MTYCLGIVTREGLVMASDSRTYANCDQVTVSGKMHTVAHPGERAVGDQVRRVADLDRAALEAEGVKYALISLDSTMRSNATVGPPIDLLVYGHDELAITGHQTS